LKKSTHSAGQGIEAGEVKLKYLDTPLLTNVLFEDEDLEEWGETAGIRPDGASKYFDTGYSVADLPDAAHLCYIEQEETAGAALPRTAIGVTDGSLEWSIGAIDASADRSVIIGTPAVIADTAGTYTNWTSFYIGNREDAGTLRLLKRTHLKSTKTTISATSPKPSLNFFVGARNNNGVADQFFANRIRYASIGTGMTITETVQYYTLVQQLQQNLQRAT
jgi:hypothetical protein